MTCTKEQIIEPFSLPEECDPLEQFKLLDFGSNMDQNQKLNPQLPQDASLPSTFPTSDPSSRFRFDFSTPTPYTDLGPGAKTAMLPEIFAKSKLLFDANGLSLEKDGPMLGAIMMNEGSRNLQRKGLFRAETKGLLTKLRASKLSPDAVGALKPEQIEKLGLTEDEAALLQKSREGALDLGALQGDPAKMKGARLKKYEVAREQARQLGLERRTEDFAEMKRLEELESQGSLTKGSPEEKRLAMLRAKPLPELSNKESGGKATLGKLSRLSEQRFAEGYENDQRRFEMHYYTKNAAAMDDYRKTMDALTKANASGDQKAAEELRRSLEEITGKNDIFMSQVVQEHPELLLGDYSALADLSSSFGTAQIMGTNAYDSAVLGKKKKGKKAPVTRGKDGAPLKKGAMSVNLPGESNHRVSLDELKASADRLTPDSRDVALQIAYLKRCGLSSLNNASEVGRAYNGSGVKPSYIQGLKGGAVTYQKTRDAQADKLQQVVPDQQVPLSDDRSWWTRLLFGARALVTEL